MRLAIVGAGAIARATAAVVASAGHAVSLWSPSGRGTADLATTSGRGRLAYRGFITGAVEVGVLDAPQALSAFPVVLIALPATAYADVFPRIAPHLGPAQTVIVSGALSLAPLWLREKAGAPGARPVVAGWGTTLATARRATGTGVEINTVRARFEVAALPAGAGAAVLATCRAVCGDRFNLAGNLLETALANINPIAHAAEVLPNLSRVDKREDWALFDCLTPAGARLLEALDAERLAIAAAFGLKVRSIHAHYHLSYHVPLGTMAEIASAIHARYQGPPGPTTLAHRYIDEDVPYGLAFLETLARAAGVPTPILSGAMTLLSAAAGRDLRAANALLPALAIEDLSPEALLARCRGEVADG